MFSKKKYFDYFSEFVNHAEYARNILKKLTEHLNSENNIVSEMNVKEIHKIENDADIKLHDIKNYLLKDFLPPIEREDILNLANRIDDLIDGIDEIVIDIDIYNIKYIRKDVFNMINFLEQIIFVVIDMLKLLKNFKNIKEIKEKIVIINQLEEEGDKLYEKSIKILYSESNDVLNILKWTKIYERIEECFDCCEEIADSVEEIILKNN